MSFFETLGVKPGLTAILGSGGKSTLLERLAAELAPLGTVLLCTSTRIYPPAGIVTFYEETAEAVAEAVAEALAAFGCVCLGRTAEQGKLAPPALDFSVLQGLADYVLVEADGAKRLPLKAHESHEPVIPPHCGRVISVLGLSGLGRPIAEAAHRPTRYAALAGVEETALITPAIAARVLRAEALGDCYYLNQAESKERQRLGRELAALLDKPAFLGSLQEDWICV